MRENLQSTVEELETSNEELKSTNEELQSTNEELQSSNEELETSKEEMQSLNEELQTVNAQLQSKLDELSQASDDMQNLLNSTDIATIFLDSKLRIKRFTTEARQMIKLIASDVGRPVGDLVANLDYDTLEEDAAEVLRTLVFREREVRTKTGDWRLVRITPYRTTENVIDGLVVTFLDINKVKRAEQAAEEASTIASGIVDTIRESLLVLDTTFRVVAGQPGVQPESSSSRQTRSSTASLFALAERPMECAGVARRPAASRSVRRGDRGFDAGARVSRPRLAQDRGQRAAPGATPAGARAAPPGHGGHHGMAAQTRKRRVASPGRARLRALRQRAERVAADHPVITGDEPTPKELRRLVHELQVHQIELEMQNEELIRAQIDLQESRDRFAALYNFAPVAYLTFEADGTVREANLAAAQLFECEPPELVGRAIWRSVVPASRAALADHFERARRDFTRQVGEFEFSTHRGHAFIGHVESQSFAAPPDGLLRIRSAILDVTRRVQAEQAVRASEREVLAISEREQRRIGADLHDGLGQWLTATEFLGAALREQIMTKCPELGPQCAQICANLRESVAQARAMSHGLVPVRMEKERPDGRAGGNGAAHQPARARAVRVQLPPSRQDGKRRHRHSCVPDRAGGGEQCPPAWPARSKSRSR